MRIFGQHLLTLVSGINFDLPYAAAALLLLCCRYSFLLYAHFQMTSSLALLCHCSKHRHIHAAHTQKLSLSPLCSLCETISATLTCSLALPHTQHVLCSPALFARPLSSHTVSLAQRRLRFAIKASRIERFHLSNFCVVVHATLGVFWLLLNHRKQKIV